MSFQDMFSSDNGYGGDDDDDDDDSPRRHHIGGSSMDSVRATALVVFGRWLSYITGETNDDELAAGNTHFLSLQEAEQIIREYAQEINSPIGTAFLIEGSSPGEVGAHIRAVVVAMVDRIMSNVLHGGVSNGMLDCAFDADENHFTFDVTDGGRKVIDEYLEEKKQKNKATSA